MGTPKFQKNLEHFSNMSTLIALPLYLGHGVPCNNLLVLEDLQCSLSLLPDCLGDDGEGDDGRRD
jgi:hypothetical protein